MNDFSELDDWDPMAEDYYNPVFNSYKDIQKSITHDLAKLYVRNIPASLTEEELLSMMSEGGRKVRHICLFPAKKYESTTAGIVGFYTEEMAKKALKFFDNSYPHYFRIDYATRKMTEKVMLRQIELYMPVKEAEKISPPQVKKSNLPQSKKINIPQSKKALKDKDECKENLQLNQPSVEPLPSKPSLCNSCGNQIGAVTLKDSRGIYCRISCRMQSLVNYYDARMAEAEKLKKAEEEKTITSDPSDKKEKTIPTAASEKYLVTSDPSDKGKEPESIVEEEKWDSCRISLENQKRRQYIRKYMADYVAKAEALKKSGKPVNPLVN